MTRRILHIKFRDKNFHLINFALFRRNNRIFWERWFQNQPETYLVKLRG